MSGPSTLARTQAPTFSELEALLTNLFASEDDGDASCRCRVESLRYSLENSWLYRGTLVADGEKKIAIKLCRDAAATGLPEARAVQEYEVLSRLHPHFAQFPGLSVPCPLLSLPQYGLVLMEWVEGPTLTELLLDRRSSQARILQEIRCAGQWLNALHQYDPGEPAPVNAEWMLGELNKEIDIRELVAGDRVARQAIQRLQNTLGPVSREKVPFARLHGDLKADNLIVSDGCFVGLDIGLISRGPVVRDVAAFLNHLDLLALHRSGLRLLAMRRSMMAAFLDGYEEGGSRMSRQAVAWVRLASALTVWAARRQRLQGVRAWPVAQGFRWLSRSLIRALR